MVAVAVPAPEGRRAPTEDGSRPRLPALDGMRGVAVVAVIAFHLGVPGLGGGFLGVDLFFVVSGFVITRLLAAEREDGGGIGLARFWTRRARRLLPQVLMVVGAVAVWTLATDPRAARTIRGQGLSALVYATNWYDVVADVGYWETGRAASPLSHLWSLAIEEQMYLVWPLVVVVVVRTAGWDWRRRLRIVALVGAAASFAAQVVLGLTASVERAYLGTDARVGAILLGAALALRDPGPAAADPPEDDPRALLVEVAGYLAVAGLAVLWATADVTSPVLFRGPLIGASLLGAALVWAVVEGPTTRLARWLAGPALVALGRRSYALYIWHLPVLVVVDDDALGTGGIALLAVRLALTVGLAEATFRLVEERVRRADGLRGRRLVVALGVPTLVVALLLLAIRPVADARAGSDPIVSRGGPDGATIMVVGDSWSRGLGVGMQEVAEGRSTIVNLGVFSCGIGDAEVYRIPTGDVPLSEECRGWEERWARAADAYRPDAVVLETGNWDQAVQRIDGAWVRPCDPAFDQRYAGRLDAAIAAAGASGADVYVVNVREGGDDGTRRLSDCVNEMMAAAVARHPGVVLLDLRSRLCVADGDCPERRDGDDVFDDTGHLGQEWQRRIAGWVLGEVAARLPEEPRTGAGADRAEGLAGALPTGADLAALGAPAMDVPPPSAGSDALDLLVTDAPTKGEPAAQRGVVATAGDAAVVAVAATAASDVTADSIAMAALERYTADGPPPEQAYLSPDTLTRVLVRRGPDPSVFVMVRQWQGVALVEAKGFAPAPDGALAAMAQVLVSRMAAVPPP